MKSAAEIFQAVACLPRRPEAVQALWDGDTTGWMVSVQAVYAYGPSFGIEEVALLRGAGGDMRIINNTVPPWPEAEIASEAGSLIETRLEIPFFFPSPGEPESDSPNWWERHLAKPCRSCGKLLLQEDELPWLGSCYWCYLATQTSATKKQG